MTRAGNSRPVKQKAISDSAFPDLDRKTRSHPGLGASDHTINDLESLCFLAFLDTMNPVPYPA
jgi:hypothetical protein